MTGADTAVDGDAASTTSRYRWLLVGSFVAVSAVTLVALWGQGRWLIVTQPGGALFDEFVLPAFFCAFLLSSIVSLRWPLIGAVLGLFTVAGMVPFAYRQLEPWSALIVVAVYGVSVAAPLSFELLKGTSVRPVVRSARHLDRSEERAAPESDRRRFLLTLFGGLSALVAGSSIGRYAYGRVWGPTHPDSEVVALPESLIDWMWCGAVTSNGCVVRVRSHAEFETAVLLIATNSELADARRIPIDRRYGRIAVFSVDGLDADERYWYATEFDGDIDLIRIGSVRTFPVRSRPLRLAFGSCARTGSNGAVFDAIRGSDPDVFVSLGDFHYGDVDVDDARSYRRLLDIQLSQPGQSALYRSVPIAYVWDDHDYGPNDSDRTAPGRAAAMQVYREYVPHYELAGPDTAIFQAFTLATVRVIMTDARSARDPRRTPDRPGKSMLGEMQRRWLLDELERSVPEHDLVIWVNPVPWISAAEPGADSWAGYAHERQEIADHIAELGLDHLVMVSGDAHVVAIDDGSHTNYSARSSHGFPLIHVAALDRSGSIKGGPYSSGPIPGGGHFGLVEVEVTPKNVDVTLIARDWRGENLLRSAFTLPRG